MSFRTSFVLSWRLFVVFMIGMAACSPAPTAPPVTAEATEPATNSTTIDISTLTGRIVFDNSEDIYTVNVDGTDLNQLTNNPGPEFDPMWSPDGTRIVYRDSRRGVNHDDEIYVMNADGSEQTDLTNNPANDWEPAWSPDGHYIIFNSPGGIYVRNPDGSAITQLPIKGAAGDLLFSDWIR